MKPRDFNITVEVGQYWVIPGNDHPSRVVSIESNLAHFDDGNFSALPLGAGFIYLWYICELYITTFSEAIPKPGQIWVSNKSQDIIFIHPNQDGTVDNMFRVLSDSSNINDGSASLFWDASSSDKEGQGISIR
jgi:hypothetical protein